MILQKLILGCNGCHTQRFFRHMYNRSRLSKNETVQVRQLMHSARIILKKGNNPYKNMLFLDRYLHRVISPEIAMSRNIYNCENVKSRWLLRQTNGYFYTSLRGKKDSKRYTRDEMIAEQYAFEERVKNRLANSRLPHGITAPYAIIIVLSLYLVWSLFEVKEVDEDKPKQASNHTVTLYRKMPLKSMSRVWGKMTCWDLPVSLREPLLGLYAWMFGVQIDEALDDNLKNYRNLNEFFRRELKPEVRIVDPVAPVTSPADGRVLHFGKVDNGIVEQVKGVNYSIQGFLGPQPGDEDETKPIDNAEFHKKMNIKPGNDLYNCIIYLAPGDYHRFHSPSDWKIAHRRHFPGELLSVNPGIARWVQGLFNMNERVVYSGSWEHGYFSYTAVGATNVGSIRIYFDEDLETNTGAPHPNHIYHDRAFGELGSSENISVRKGTMLGEFNLGSTIVLLFEAPSNFQFDVKPGQKVQFGESLGGLLD